MERAIIVNILNLKGGVGKSITTIQFATILSKIFKYRVLVIDNDKQGNVSKFFGLHSYERRGVQDILTYDELDAKENQKLYPKDVIFKTEYENIDIITTNMNLLRSEQEVLLNATLPQQTRLKNFLNPVTNNYDFIIIDNAPDLGIAVTNSLVFADHVLVPLKVDQFSFEGLDFIEYQIERIKRSFNPTIKLVGCFVTQFQNNNVNNSGSDYLDSKYPMFDTKIRKATAVDQSTFAAEPLIDYAPKCKATIDYIALVNEYLEVCINGEEI